MRVNIFLLILVVAGTLAVTYVLNQPVRPTVQEVPVSTIQPVEAYPLAPDLLLTSVRKETFHLYDFKGKIILVNFWASWCVPCVIEFPQMLALAEKEPDRLVFLAVSVDASTENIERFIARLDDESRARLNLPNVHIIHDPDKKISQDVFQTVRYPETLVIGSDLTLREKIIGASEDFSSEEFRARLMEKFHE
ncbi:MAG: TlpA family protein disulfide reductase [Rhodospirillales bacterium]|nr:TlpA family protein disulfide reductase [Rhodospirillales bacterium]MCB9965378.1 TlpA family protein disulfide reductase [Rhodospirillales bacterium]MCB9973273.1 TlpA family protein disulfide reductase [Rhodospirillales bacterium]MCB9980595.1 TlpA family protein disulfide reductase [Rhodospirillales bacterium]